jgi:hypothetical protein
MSSEAEKRAAALLSLKAGNRQQLEAMAARYDELRGQRDNLVREVEVLQCDVEQKTLQRQQDESAAEASPAAQGGAQGRRWSETAAPEDVDLTSLDGMTLTDEQIADALSNLIDFSATKSNIRSSEK